MKKNDLYDFIFFGTAFRYLQDIHSQDDVRSKGGALENIASVLRFLAQNKMRVSINAAHELIDFAQNLEARADENCSLDSDQCRELNVIMERL